MSMEIVDNVCCRYCDAFATGYVSFIGFVCDRHLATLGEPVLLDGLIDSLSVCEMAAAIRQEFEDRTRRLQRVADHVCGETR